MSIGKNIGVPMRNVNRNSDTFLRENAGMSIGKRVREARKDAGLTQQQLAAKVGIKQSTLSELENGDSAGTGYVATMASALGVSALWLETGKGPKKLESLSVTLSGPGVTPVASTDEIAELISLYGKNNPTWRKKIIDLARIGASQSQSESPEGS